MLRPTLELGNRKRSNTILAKTRDCIFPVPRNRRSTVRLSRDGRRVSMFLFCFLSLDKLSVPFHNQPERTHERTNAFPEMDAIGFGWENVRPKARLFFHNSGPALITSRVSVFFFCFSLIFNICCLIRNLAKHDNKHTLPIKIRKSNHTDRKGRERERVNKYSGRQKMRACKSPRQRQNERRSAGRARRYDAVGIV